VNLSNTSLVSQALQWHETGLDFADAFHLAQSQNYVEFYTFDEKFVKKAKELTNCEVKLP
jgi:predicted nucleic acid-binding protein